MTHLIKTVDVAFFVAIIVMIFMPFVFTGPNSTEVLSASDRSILNWTPPQEFMLNFPYYLSGFDRDGRPVWIVEFGKWNMRPYVEEGGKRLETLTQYLEQGILRLAITPNLTQIHDQKKPANLHHEFIVIFDLDQYSMRQLTSISTLTYTYNIARKFTAVKENPVKTAFVINTNFVAQTMYNFISPIFSGVSGQVEVYGTNALKWKPRLLRLISKDQLPEKYGGVRGHSPAQRFG